MSGWDDARDAHREVYHQHGGYQEPRHEAKFGHELLAGAASFEGFKLYEDHQRKEGKQVNHALAKELLAGFVGSEVDKLAETKGMDEYDRERAHRHARESAHKMYDHHYGGRDNYDPSYDRPQYIEKYGNHDNY